ncbi:flagellar basal body-associated protein FliL [Bacillus sp. FJAT-42376]|uniref:flagellar basal body-associated protein FliL n=1 Tax=Bacillus sp. FJAT-42376 TaxID=2014076 RepID=UPI000F4D9896|nr:flagellar basal body-associated protein FliL [Bacillus sp. FJAT-42376]AZB42947.1 flagellar basal body-associated protein FliL [Bacillus sp. FJAT-42376]
MNKKLLSIMFIIITSITLIGVAALAVMTNFFEKDTSGAPTIDEVVESSVDVPELTTNLAGGSIVRISLKLETDSKKAKTELEKREFQVKDVVISELSNMKADQLAGTKGKEQLKKTVMEGINKLMQEGKVEKVYTTSFILQ